jgi:predicted alpha/beta-fold hydrolase
MSWSGHYWTLAPHLRRQLQKPGSVDVEQWSWSVRDSRYGSVTLHGQMQNVPSSTELLVVVHGLGGSSASGYALAATNVALAAGMSCLRLNLRGASQCGQDFYHAGLSEDLDVIATDPRLSHFSAIYFLGYSIGGHVCLRWSATTRAHAPKVRAVASLCAPLDLTQSVAAFDAWHLALYRGHILNGLKRMYRAVAAHRDVLLPPEKADRITRIREWDECIVAPRHGFQSAQHYYREASVAERLRDITLPTLIVVAKHDPMVPFATLEEALKMTSKTTTLKCIEGGGHVGFPANTTLGFPGSLGVEQQIIHWLQASHK